jgi:hypothetical protein
MLKTLTFFHTYGDCHAYYGWRDIHNPLLNISMYNIDAKTAASFGTEKNINFDYLLNAKNVCFSYGETDIRANMFKFDENYKDITDYIVENYFKTIEFIANEVKDLNIFVFNIIPPVRYRKGSLGTDEQRKTYTCYFNKKLKEKCLEYNYIFLDVYDNYCDSKGLLNPQLGDDYHITNPVHIKEFLLKTL